MWLTETIRTTFAGHSVRAVDATGAGDAFNGALAVALAEGRPLAEAAAWANRAAALSVQRAGAQPSLAKRCGNRGLRTVTFGSYPSKDAGQAAPLGLSSTVGFSATKSSPYPPFAPHLLSRVDR